MAGAENLGYEELQRVMDEQTKEDKRRRKEKKLKKKLKKEKKRKKKKTKKLKKLEKEYKAHAIAARMVPHENVYTPAPYIESIDDRIFKANPNINVFLISGEHAKELLSRTLSSAVIIEGGSK